MSALAAAAVSTPARRRIRWSHTLPAIALAAAAITVCGLLGWWQWGRASEQGEVRQPAPPAAIAEVAQPATTLGSELGRAVWADGAFADANAALVHNREVDGQPAVLVVRAFAVDADATGTGEPATLPVLVGWLAPSQVANFDAAAPFEARVEGHLRSGEGAQPAPDPVADTPPGSFWADRLSPAVLAQHWQPPMYSALLTATEAEAGLRPLPEPAQERGLDFRSLAYAGEWWLFGAFFAFIALRWIRDNGLMPRVPDQTQEDTP